MSVSLASTVGEAKAWLRTKIEEGHRCPVCTQMAKVYKRKINSRMAKTLITMYKHSDPGEFVHAPSLPGDTHECSQLVWWGLIEEERILRPDGGRAGWWRLTDAGRAFAEGRATVYKYARIYDSKCLGLVGDQVSIKDALGEKFDYAELMSM